MTKANCNLRHTVSTTLLALMLMVGLPLRSIGQGDASKIGKWDPVFTLPNVAIHAHLLPNGKVLFWGRREWRTTEPRNPNPDLDPRDTVCHLWNPADGKVETLSSIPRDQFGNAINLFCSGHTFLADGRLFVAGGHILDSVGEVHAVVFDYRDNTWKPVAQNMNLGRWYPTAVTLPDGRVLVASGQFKPGELPNPLQQVWDPANPSVWRDIVDFKAHLNYPRLHVTRTGEVFMAGPRGDSFLLSIPATGAQGLGGWEFVDNKLNGPREDGSCVMHRLNKVLYIGGGRPPTNAAELMDLDLDRKWRPIKPMHFARRHCNATLLPDGTVFVNGGTRGNGGPGNGFNDTRKDQQVNEAELWDPTNEDAGWELLAAADEDAPRQYHSVAVLLPDGRIFTAGGGEWRPADNNPSPNDPKDSHPNAQIYSPPYLYRGSRPEITSVTRTQSGATPDPAEVTEIIYATPFEVVTPQAAEIGKVSLVRLSSVTHSFNFNQRYNELPFSAGNGKLSVSAPADPNECPPGDYLLFVISKITGPQTGGVPSVAKVVRIDKKRNTQ